MAREHANIRLDMWGDADWRALSRDAQWLYELLLTHPDTNRAGVGDWRPGRLSRMAAATTTADVRAAAQELEQRFFVVIDEDTEEILVRSYVKYDGVLRQPNMSVTMANDWTGVASARLRGVIAFEVQKLSVSRPEWPVWNVEKLKTLLSSPGIDVRADPTGDPSVDPTPDPKALGSGDPSVEGPSTTTAPSTTTEASLPGDAKLKEHRLPADWAPIKNHYDLAKNKNLDISAEADAFRLHAETHDRHAARWNAAFTTWLKKANPAPATITKRNIPKNDEWMYR